MFTVIISFGTWRDREDPAYYQKHVTISFTCVINIQNTVGSFEAHKKHHLPKKLHSVAERKRNERTWKNDTSSHLHHVLRWKIKRMSRRWRSQMTIFIYKYFLLTASTMTTTIVDDNSWLCTMAVFSTMCKYMSAGIHRNRVYRLAVTVGLFTLTPPPFKWWKLKLCWSRSSFPLFMFYPLSVPSPACANTMHKSSFYSTVKPPDCGDIRQPVINVPPRWNLSRACRVNSLFLICVYFWIKGRFSDRYRRY